MRRVPAAIIIVLVVGVGLGLVAGKLFVGPSPAPAGVAAIGSPAPSSSAGDSGSPSAPSDSGSAAPSDSGSPVPPSPSPSPTPVPTPVLVPDPLDGVLVTPAIAKRHVVAVMIDDLWAARPQSGLSSASVVWQAPAEGGIPRYMALFSEGNPPAVGPIRSSRLYYIAWAAEWNAVYAHVGGSPQALALLSSSQGRGKVVWNADEIRIGDKYMWRIKTRQPPHNMYSDAAHLRQLVKAVGAPAQVNYKTHWQFAPDATVDQRPVGGSIVVPYLANKISYQYNAATNTYLRTVSVEGKQVDAGNKQRIAPKNVVVMWMSFAPLNDGSAKHRLEAKFTGSGKAWLFTNGNLTKGTWKKASITAPTYLYDASGQPMTFTTGQTFVQVIPIGTAVTYKLGKVPAPASPSPSPIDSPSPTDSPSPSPSPVGMLSDSRLAV